MLLGRLLLMLVLAGFCSLGLPVSLLASEGIPRVVIKDGWFFVDGEKFFVKGVCYFEAHDVQGHYVQNSPEVLEYEFRKIKEAGFNTIRTYLTPEKLALAARQGLMVFQDSDRLCFSDEYQDPARLQQLQSNIDEIVGFSKSFDNILLYSIDNEPNIRAMYRQGEAVAEAWWRQLDDKVKAVQPGARTTVCLMPPCAFATAPMCNVSTLNLYPFNPAAQSIGYAAYADWFRRSHAAGRVFLFSEYGWTEDLPAFGPAMTRLLDEQLQAGSSGSFLFTWRTWGREKTADNSWWGVIPNEGLPGDYTNEPRTIYRDLRTYFEAVVVSPKLDGLYVGSVPFEVYGSERTAAIEVCLEDRTLALKRDGRFWWKGVLSFGAGEDGAKRGRLTARDSEGKILVEKTLIFRMAPAQRVLRVEIRKPSAPLGQGDAYQADLVVTDEQGRPVPNQSLVLGVTQSAVSEWTSVAQRVVTDTNGWYRFCEPKLLPGYFTLMAGVDAIPADAEAQADVDIRRINE